MMASCLATVILEHTPEHLVLIQRGAFPRPVARQSKEVTCRLTGNRQLAPRTEGVALRNEGVALRNDGGSRKDGTE